MHGIFRQLLRSPRDFIGGNRGAVAILVAAMSIPLVGTTGLAIDTARGYLLKARMSQALDAAALAGGRVFFQPQRDADIQIYFDANFPPGFMHAELGTLQIAADKVVVILTDGYNQLYSAAKDYYGHSWFTDSDYTAHGRISAGRLGTTSNFTTARNQLNDRMAETCEAMKTEGIVIYTITFAVANNSGGNAIRDIFRDCATTPGYFFD
ncbi:MAG: pilus assembly protein TadG-related protein, partial [Rhodovibrionaceae bacterium]